MNVASLLDKYCDKYSINSLEDRLAAAHTLLQELHEDGYVTEEAVLTRIEVWTAYMNELSVPEQASDRLDALCSNFSTGKPDASDILEHAQTVKKEFERCGIKLAIHVKDYDGDEMDVTFTVIKERSDVPA